ncbi:MAG: hypothetical protein QF719_01240 [Chloroflexota bacterium]|jgi:hypothetical protein|nr:hypothetical protein [Chloroflexota bacterium]MDP6509344.1 hypothetical protein [Chloroflexota bacterium]MDP6756833.1 hypothetical protein [Chloroflexota bacterium]
MIRSLLILAFLLVGLTSCGEQPALFQMADYFQAICANLGE